MNIINFLFGWLIKPQLLQTPLDGLICVIEIFIVFPIVIVMILSIAETIKEWRERRKQR